MRARTGFSVVGWIKWSLEDEGYVELWSIFFNYGAEYFLLELW